MFKVREDMFIGFYRGWVWLTYIGAISAIFGIYNAIYGEVWIALICLLISGVCDSFDGKIAAKFKRTKEEKQYGTQIDSLCDVVSFLILPVMICYGMGLNSRIHIVIYIGFILCGLIRLAYFNVVSEKNGEKSKGTFYYRGLPVTSVAIVFPLVYLLRFFTTIDRFETIYISVMTFVAFLFILNFKLKNPSIAWKYVFLGFVVIMISVFVYLGVR